MSKQRKKIKPKAHHRNFSSRMIKGRKRKSPKRSEPKNPRPEPYKYVFPALSRQLAAQCWCDWRTRKKVMDVLLSEVFAETLDTQMKVANLGCATTGQLLREITARVDLNYSTVFYEEPKPPEPVNQRGRKICREVGFDRWLRDCAEFAMQSEWIIDPDMPEWWNWFMEMISPKDAVHRLFKIVRENG